MPDSYTLHKKFWDGLPGRITTKMMIPYGMSAEETDMKGLVSGAIYVEYSLKEFRWTEDVKMSRSSTTDQTPAPTRPLSGHSTVRDGEGDHSSHPRDSDGHDRPHSLSRDRGDRRLGRGSRFNRDARPGHDSRLPSTPIQSGTPSVRPSPRPTAPLGNNQCWLYKKEGHWSNECPDKDKYTNTARINVA